MPRIFWGIFAAMLAVNLCMNLGTAPKIEALSGGLRQFDMRVTGYGFAEAQAFVTALGAEGRALYLGLQLWLDMAFPPLLGAVLFLVYRWLFPGWPGLVIGALSMTEVVADTLENAAIAVMLRAGPDGMTQAMVARASQWTQVKWSLACVGVLALVVGLALRLWRRRAVDASG